MTTIDILISRLELGGAGVHWDSSESTFGQRIAHSQSPQPNSFGHNIISRRPCSAIDKHFFSPNSHLPCDNDRLVHAYELSRLTVKMFLPFLRRFSLFGDHDLRVDQAGKKQIFNTLNLLTTSEKCTPYQTHRPAALHTRSDAITRQMLFSAHLAGSTGWKFPSYVCLRIRRKWKKTDGVLRAS